MITEVRSCDSPKYLQSSRLHALSRLGRQFALKKCRPKLYNAGSVQGNDTAGAPLSEQERKGCVA